MGALAMTAPLLAPLIKQQSRYRNIKNRSMTSKEMGLFHQYASSDAEYLLPRLVNVLKADETTIRRLAPHVYSIDEAMKAATASILEGVDIIEPTLTFGDFGERVLISEQRLPQYLQQHAPAVFEADYPLLQQLYARVTGRLQDTIAKSLRGTLGTVTR